MKAKYPKPERLTEKTVKYWHCFYDDYHGIRITEKDNIYYLLNGDVNVITRYFNYDACLAQAQKLSSELLNEPSNNKNSNESNS